MNIKKIFLVVCAILLCTSLTGCTIGSYSFFEYFEDENGNQRFMLLGQHGALNEGEEIESENLDETDIVDAEFQSDLESITGSSLKQGWTSSENSILKGTNVSVKKDCDLFSITLDQDKEVTIFYDIVLDGGEYQIVFIDSDNTEHILQDGKIIILNEKLLFSKGQNRIAIYSENAVFEKISITIMGIEVSDFQ